MKDKILFILIVILAIGLRFWDLGKNPPGINLDEAAIGYNAYSILKTGRDEYGQFMPLAFRSLDDYKPPLYVYLTVPSVAIFGLNEFAVRFPSAILGVGAVILVYFLTRELFKSALCSLLSALLLAISPWHLQFTRTAYETGSLAFFTSAGLLFFLFGLKKWPWLILSAIIFGSELFLYQAAKVFVPLFLFAISIAYLRKQLAVFWVVFLIFFIPTIVLSVSREGRLRAYGTSIFQDYRPPAANLELKRQDWLRDDWKSAAVFHPEAFSFVPEILKNYLIHLSPWFFISPNLGAKVTYAPNVGLMYLWELPFLLAGMYFLANLKDKRPLFIFGCWLLFSPVAASVTTGLPSSIRTAVFLPSLQMITAVGIIGLLKKYRWLIFCLLPFAFCLFLFYMHMYFVHAPIVNSKVWYQGYRQIIKESFELSKKYDRVLVSNHLDQPLNFYQFFLKYDPVKFLIEDGGRVSGGFAENQNHLGKFYFRQNLEYQRERKVPKTLFVGTPQDFPSEVAIPIKKYQFLSGEESAYIVAGDYQ